jgi:hypothetical protein
VLSVLGLCVAEVVISILPDPLRIGAAVVGVIALVLVTVYALIDASHIKNEHAAELEERRAALEPKPADTMVFEEKRATGFSARCYDNTADGVPLEFIEWCYEEAAKRGGVVPSEPMGAKKFPKKPSNIWFDRMVERKVIVGRIPKFGGYLDTPIHKARRIFGYE